MTRHDDSTPAKLSRGEVEVLCILHAVGAEGCHVGELGSRLGLSDSLAAPVAQGMDPLVLSGLLARTNDWFAVTDAGRALLTGRLRELGLG